VEITYLRKKGGGEGDVRMLDPCGSRAEQRRRRRIYRVVAREEGRARGVRAREGTAGRTACGGGAAFERARGGPGARRASAEGRARGVRRGVRAREGRAGRAACECGGPGARRAVAAATRRAVAARRKRPSERNARAREKVRARGRFRLFIFVGRIGADENSCCIFVDHRGADEND
jgi:hypothetical protein